MINKKVFLPKREQVTSPI